MAAAEWLRVTWLFLAGQNEVEMSAGAVHVLGGWRGAEEVENCSLPALGSAVLCSWCFCRADKGQSAVICLGYPSLLKEVLVMQRWKSWG